MSNRQSKLINHTTSNDQVYSYKGYYYEIHVIETLRGHEKLKNVTRLKTFPNSTWNAYFQTGKFNYHLTS